MTKPTVFIGSSEAHRAVAEAIADGLQDRMDTTVWKERVFRPNDGFLARLAITPDDYDFAVIVWAPDDVTTTNDGRSEASPRDNVIFETGLFMGALGLNHVFIVQDETVKL